MQVQMIECDSCSTAPEDHVCAKCGRTGEQIANERWHAILWSVIDPETT